MQPQKIEFRKERDFTSVLGDSIKFLKQNFKSLFSSIILVIGPIILLTGLAYSYMQTVIMSNSFSGMSGGNMFNETYFTSLGIVYLLMFINTVLLNSVVYNFMCLYNEKPEGEKITVSEVASRVWSSLGRVLASMLVFLIIVIFIGLAFALIGFGFGSMGSGMGPAGAILVVLLVLFIFFGILILTPVLAYVVSAGFYVIIRDKKFIFSAFGTVRRYLLGNFWWTWLIMIVALIALSVLQLLFNLPASIMTVSETFTRMRSITHGTELPASGNSILLMVLYTIGMFFTTCSSAILHLVCGFNFLSQEEKHEGKGLMSRMDEIK